MDTFANRMLRAAKLQPSLYEEVEEDASATGQALLVVILSSLAAGIGTLGRGGPGFLLGVLGALSGWLVWAFVIYFIGTRFLPTRQTRADYGQLLRTIGFASAPGIIRIFGIIPGLDILLWVVAGVWMLAAMVIAVREALDYQSTMRAVGVCLIGWIVQAAVIALIVGLLGLPRA